MVIELTKISQKGSKLKLDSKKTQESQEGTPLAKTG